jgi:hypothetical protein
MVLRALQETFNPQKIFSEDARRNCCGEGGEGCMQMKYGARGPAAVVKYATHITHKPLVLVYPDHYSSCRG